MTCARSVLLILFLLAGSLSPPDGHAQSAAALPETGDSRGFALEQNYPNPVNPETWIPFQLEPFLFGQNQEVLVTIRIYNILSQPVAIPEALEHPRGDGTRLINLPYSSPGRYIAYWDGSDIGGRPVPSGVYYVQLVIGDETQTRKMIVLNERSRRRIFPW